MTTHLLKLAALASGAIALSACYTPDANMQAGANAPVVKMADVQASLVEKGIDPDAMDCKRMAVSGTRVKTKICKTNAEWARERELAKRNAAEYQRRSAQTGTKPGGGN